MSMSINKMEEETDEEYLEENDNIVTSRTARGSPINIDSNEQ